MSRFTSWGFGVGGGKIRLQENLVSCAGDQLDAGDFRFLGRFVGGLQVCFSIDYENSGFL